MKNLSETHVAIIGLGLMGGSLAAALSGNCASITGIDQNAESVNYAKEKGWICHGADQLDNNSDKVDAIILATPVRGNSQAIGWDCQAGIGAMPGDGYWQHKKGDCIADGTAAGKPALHRRTPDVRPGGIWNSAS